jgi:sn-glycerol 3-phosphate transport system substrate-binding protein
VAAFQLHLQPEVQSASHKRTGYLPVTTAAYGDGKSGFTRKSRAPM